VQSKLTFLGAARNVTGSRYLFETDGIRILVDCGLYQERQLSKRNWEPFSIPPNTIDVVLLTHAHVDHCGLLPKLVREGFQGRIYCTPATAEIAKLILLDAAHLQEEDAEFKKKRHEKEGRKGPFPEVPLYTVEEAKATLPLFYPVDYDKHAKLGRGVEAIFHNAGHVLGSSMVELIFGQGKQKRSIIFSGDIGRFLDDMLPDPNIFSKTDYVVIESTYGDHLHTDPVNREDMLAEIINSTYKAGGNIVVPSFALQRAQDILYNLSNLLSQGKIPHLRVFLDSPLATSITEVYKHHCELLDPKMARPQCYDGSLFSFPGLKMVQTTEESKALNNINGTVMIIAGSGMCNGGRIKHHLVNNISRPESTILFIGYQAVGTLGRQIIDGAHKVRILGQLYPVRAKIVEIHGFSAHADKQELFRWLSGLVVAPRRIFVTHGESEVAEKFGEFLKEKTGWDVLVPEYGEEVLLD
jgi:metallo-beta-lactamase family protein